MNYPIDNLRPDNFEKLAFYLLDDMGFKNLEWRKGGEGVSATDGGRDLSGKYAKVEPDDSIVIENWWIEVKHRSNTLKKSTVQSIVLNSAARKDVDVFAIFTNNVISNSTLDWIKEFQNTHSKPRIVVWQKHDIERILRKYPKTTSMFFPESLTLPEQLEGVKQRFWNQLGYPTIGEVELFWTNLQSLSWDGSKLLPIIIADCAMDGFYVRKWGLVITDELLIDTLLVGLINVPFLSIRFERQGVNQLPFMRGLEYLLQSALIRLDLNKVVDLLLNMFNYADFSNPPPPELSNMVIHQLLSNVYSNILRNCSHDCERYSFNSSISNEIGSFYFRKFSSSIENEKDDTKPFVLISLNTIKCKLNLFPIGVHCALGDDIPENITERPVLTEFLGIIQNVLLKRIAEVTGSSK